MGELDLHLWWCLCMGNPLLFCCSNTAYDWARNKPCMELITLLWKQFSWAVSGSIVWFFGLGLDLYWCCFGHASFVLDAWFRWFG